MRAGHATWILFEKDWEPGIGRVLEGFRFPNIGHEDERPFMSRDRKDKSALGVERDVCIVSKAGVAQFFPWPPYGWCRGGSRFVGQPAGAV